MTLRIVVDSREKHPYTFNGEDVELLYDKLDTGDYTIEGLSHIVTIERKMSVSEISQNLINKRFTRELDRMREIPHCFIICEFSLQNVLDFPVGANLPARVFKKIKISGHFILKRMCEVMRDYPHVHVIFCDNRFLGEEMTLSILKRFA
jgi:ERCC4-type nuclease